MSESPRLGWPRSLLTGFPGIMNPAKNGEMTLSDSMMFVVARIMQVGIFRYQSGFSHCTSKTYNKDQPNNVRHEESPPYISISIHPSRIWGRRTYKVIENQTPT
jgi:hypothetical protein